MDGDTKPERRGQHLGREIRENAVAGLLSLRRRGLLTAAHVEGVATGLGVTGRSVWRWLSQKRRLGAGWDADFGHEFWNARQGQSRLRASTCHSNGRFWDGDRWSRECVGRPGGVCPPRRRTPHGRVAMPGLRACRPSPGGVYGLCP
jgi:hypothetical protein